MQQQNNQLQDYHEIYSATDDIKYQDDIQLNEMMLIQQRNAKLKEEYLKLNKPEFTILNLAMPKGYKLIKEKILHKIEDKKSTMKDQIQQLQQKQGPKIIKPNSTNIITIPKQKIIDKKKDKMLLKSGQKISIIKPQNKNMPALQIKLNFADGNMQKIIPSTDYKTIKIQPAIKIEDSSFSNYQQNKSETKLKLQIPKEQIKKQEEDDQYFNYDQMKQEENTPSSRKYQKHLSGIEKYTMRFNVDKFQQQNYQHQKYKITDSSQIVQKYFNQLPSQMKDLFQLIKSLKQWKLHCRYFLEQVDVVAFNIPTYNQIIKKPMDLGTVQEKLLNQEYKSPDEFYSDVNLIWDNAMLFNPESHSIHKSAQIMKDHFESQWNGYKIEQNQKKLKEKSLQETILATPKMQTFDNQEILDIDKQRIIQQDESQSPVDGRKRMEIDYDLEQKLINLEKISFDIMQFHKIREGNISKIRQYRQILVSPKNYAIQQALKVPLNNKPIQIQERRLLLKSLHKMKRIDSLAVYVLLQQLGLIPKNMIQDQLEIDICQMDNKYFRILQYFLRQKMKILSRKKQKKLKKLRVQSSTSKVNRSISDIMVKNELSSQENLSTILKQDDNSISQQYQDSISQQECPSNTNIQKEDNSEIETEISSPSCSAISESVHFDFEFIESAPIINSQNQ